MNAIFRSNSGSSLKSAAPSSALQKVGSWLMMNEAPAAAERRSRLNVLMKVHVIPVIGRSGSPHLKVSEVRLRQGTPTFWRIRSTTSRAVI